MTPIVPPVGGGWGMHERGCAIHQPATLFRVTGNIVTG